MGFTFYKTIVSRELVHQSGHKKKLDPIEHYQDSDKLHDYKSRYGMSDRNEHYKVLSTAQDMYEYHIDNENILGMVVRIPFSLSGSSIGVIVEALPLDTYLIYLPDMDLFVEKQLTMKPDESKARLVTDMAEQNFDSYFVGTVELNPKELPQDFTYRSKETIPSSPVAQPIVVQQAPNSFESLKSFVLGLVGLG